MLTCALIIDEEEETIVKEGAAKSAAKDASIEYRHCTKSAGLGVFLLVQLLALRLVFSMNQKALPWNWLVPLLVTMTTWPPLALPYSAVALPEMIWISPRASTLGL